MAREPPIQLLPILGPASVSSMVGVNFLSDAARDAIATLWGGPSCLDSYFRRRGAPERGIGRLDVAPMSAATSVSMWAPSRSRASFFSGQYSHLPSIPETLRSTWFKTLEMTNLCTPSRPSMTLRSCANRGASNPLGRCRAECDERRG